MIEAPSMHNSDAIRQCLRQNSKEGGRREGEREREEGRKGGREREGEGEGQRRIVSMYLGMNGRMWDYLFNLYLIYCHNISSN